MFGVVFTFPPWSGRQVNLAGTACFTAGKGILYKKDPYSSVF